MFLVLNPGKRYYHFVKFVLVCNSLWKKVKPEYFTFSADFSKVFFNLKQRVDKLFVLDIIKLV